MDRRKAFVCAVLVGAAVAVMAAAAGAGVPRKINYQGRLTDAITGEPLAGPVNLTFRLYDDPLSGSPLWEEGQILTADSAGVVSAVLGGTVSIDVDLGDAAWLEVEVAGEVLSPRREIVSVPYAFRAMDADSLAGEPASAYVLKGEPGSVTVEMIAGGTGSGLNADLLDSLSAAAFADSGHIHDDRYYLKEELNTSGMINASENPIDWTKLKGVPAGFADGTDDAGGTGDGHSLDAADGSPTDVVYVDGGGHVGVGTTTPDDMLDVAGDADLTGDLKMGGMRVLSIVGTGNTAVGQSAGFFNAGEYNTFVGGSAGQMNTTGTANTLVGYGAGAFNDSGWGNTYLGYLTGSQNIDADINTFLGYEAGRFTTVGSNNAFMGAMAGWQTVDGGYNTFVGTGAGYSNVGGYSNTYLGNSAGQSNVDGDGNVFLGHFAGSSETGSNKLYIHNSFSDPPLIYGDFSAKKVGIGTKALEAELDVAGACNVSTAYSIAGSTVVAVPGQYNTHLGVGAGAQNTGASGTFVGSHAGYSNDGDHNTLVGAEAGKKNTSGGANTFVGFGSGAGNTSGGTNTFIGSWAGLANTTGEYNTYIGGSTGIFSSSGSRNTLVGYNAGSVAGSDNVCIGYQAGATSVGSNKLCIANGGTDDDVLIYGDFSTGQIRFGGAHSSDYDFDFRSDNIEALRVGNDEDWVEVTLSGRCAIGLGDGFGHEAGVVFGGNTHYGNNYVGIYARSDDGTLGTATCFHESGYVGIGTMVPDRELHILSHNPRILIEAETSNPEVNFRSYYDAFGETWAVYKDSTTNDLRFYQNGDKVTIEGATGNVGIGTTNPGTCKLYVNGGASGTSGWGICSDLKFKDNIEGIGDALGKILCLRGVTFDWKTDEYPDMNFAEGTHYGCIAQEVEEVLPEVVREGPEGDKAVAYSEIVPVLIESIKAQQRRIELLEARIAALEK